MSNEVQSSKSEQREAIYTSAGMRKTGDCSGKMKVVGFLQSVALEFQKPPS